MKTVDLQLSSLLEDLGNGLTWLKKEDVGYGSIQEKYNASDVQMKIIRKHPKLQNIEPTIVVFNIIDDTEQTATAAASVKKAKYKEQEVVLDSSIEIKMESNSTTLKADTFESNTLQNDMSAFANL